ncbi:YitT family protein [Oceanobacillus timonensis]|uniref:YitT family protein n=1 Tax=Oceanobacillus timonensis TaxID=1926285 RepID=UPI002481B4D9|nr:YitT family protein [Oceanobacillus timonensis]
MLTGTLLVALALTVFSMPNQISDGGVPGIALLLYFQFGLSPGIVTFISFIILQLISIKFLPRNVLIITTINVPLLSLFIFLTENIITEPLGDPLVAAIFAGLIGGVGLAFIIQAGSSTGGTSQIARLLAQKFEWNIILTTFLLDTVIVFAGIFVIGPLYTLYTVISLSVGKIASDYVIGGLDAKKAVTIVSQKYREIGKQITKNMSSSATYFNGYGTFTDREQLILYVVVPNYRLIFLKRIIREVDPDAFIVVHNVKDVSGGTFFASPEPAVEGLMTDDIMNEAENDNQEADNETKN